LNSPSATNAPLSSLSILNFSAANFPLGALAVAVAVYLPPYFAGHVGMSLAAVGAAWPIVRLLDIGIDPALGLFMDRTRSAFGRYRLWLVIGIPILCASIWALFLAKPGVGEFYLVGWLLILYLGISIVSLGHAAWAATLTTEYHERSRIFGIVAAVGVVGAVLVLVLPIIGDHIGWTFARSVQAMGLFILISVPLTLALTTARTPEYIAPDIDQEQFKLQDYWSLIVKPDLMRLYLAQICLTLGPGWMSALYIFFFSKILGYSPGAVSGLLLVYVVAGILGAPLTARMSRDLGKHRTLMVTTTAYSIGLMAVLVVPRGNIPIGTVVMFWCGFMASGFDLMIRAMLADVADEVRLEQGKERLSLVYALNGVATKIALAGSIGLTFWILSKFGFNAKDGAVNTAEALAALKWTYILGPIAFVMMGGACVIGWKLTAHRHAEVRAELARRDASATAGT